MIKLSCNTKNSSEKVDIIIVTDMIKRALEEHVKAGKSLDEVKISIKAEADGLTYLVLS
jgi:hypothetical protein